MYERKELECFQVKTRTRILLWEQEAEKGNRKRLLEVISQNIKTSESWGVIYRMLTSPRRRTKKIPALSMNDLSLINDTDEV